MSSKLHSLFGLGDGSSNRSDDSKVGDVGTSALKYSRSKKPNNEEERIAHSRRASTSSLKANTSSSVLYACPAQVYQYNPDAQNIGVKGVAISCSIQNNTRTGFLLIYEPQTKQPIVNIRISDSISVTGELFLGMHDSDGKYWTLMMRNNVEMNEIVRQILIIEFWAQENERSIVGMKLGGQSDELAGKNASFRKKRIIQGTGTLFSLDFDSNELVNLSVKNLQPLTNEDISIVFTFPTPSLNDLFSAQSLRIRRNIAEMTDSEHKIFLMERTDCLLADNEIHIPEKTSVLFDFQIHSLNSNEEKLDTSVFVAEEANLENETEEKLKLIQKIAKIGGEHVLPNLSQAPHISSLENSTSEMKLSENGQHIDVDSQLEKNFKIDDESIIQINKKLDQILDNISFISIQSPRNNMKKLGSRESNDVIPDVSPSTIVLVFENLIKEKEDLRHSLNHSSEIIASLKRSISDSRAQHLEEMQTQSSVHESQYISLKETSQKQYKQILELQRDNLNLLNQVNELNLKIEELNMKSDSTTRIPLQASGSFSGQNLQGVVNEERKSELSGLEIDHLPSSTDLSSGCLEENIKKLELANEKLRTENSTILNESKESMENLKGSIAEQIENAKADLIRNIYNEFKSSFSNVEREKNFSCPEILAMLRNSMRNVINSTSNE